MRTPLRRMYVLSFLFSLHIAISAYVNSTFLTSIISEKYVGILYTIGSVLALLALSNTSVVLNNLGNRRLTFILLLINILALTAIIKSHDPYIIGSAFVAFITTNTLIAFCLDIFIEHFGNPETVGKTRGMYLTITNLAWFISPLITGYLIVREGGYIAIYAMAFVATAIMIIGLFFSVTTFKDKIYNKTPFLKTYKFLKTNRHIKSITIINFILQFFFAVMVVYTPIYLVGHMGLTWNKIGVIFTFMLLPFVILALPIGILVDKYHFKKRNLLTTGIIITALATACITFTNTTNIFWWALILFLTRVGASIIETVSEIYFFTHVKEEDSALLSVFRDMSPIGYIVGTLFGTAFLSFFPFKYLFLTLGLIVILALYYITHLKHHHEEYPNANQ